jgi:hypothetical protein
MKITRSLVLLFIVSCMNYAGAQTDSVHKRLPYISVNFGYETSLTNVPGGVSITSTTTTDNNSSPKGYNFYNENCTYVAITGFAPFKNSTIGMPFSISYSQPWFDLKNYIATQNEYSDMEEYTGNSAGRYKILSLMTGIDFLLLKLGPVRAELKLMTGLTLASEPQLSYSLYNPYAVYSNSGVNGGAEPVVSDQTSAQTNSIAWAFSAGLSVGYKINRHIRVALNCDLLFAYVELPESINKANMINLHTNAGIIYTFVK